MAHAHLVGIGKAKCKAYINGAGVFYRHAPLTAGITRRVFNVAKQNIKIFHALNPFR